MCAKNGTGIFVLVITPDEESVRRERTRERFKWQGRADFESRDETVKIWFVLRNGI